MEKPPIYTIGHGRRKVEDFIQILRDFKIAYLIDVRSQPYSKFNPQFNRENLKKSLIENNIGYVFMGDSIGGRPSDKSCYNIKGKVDYNQLKTKDFFIKGIDRLKTAYYKNIPVAIMCCESKPHECHRSKLIGSALLEDNISLQHIDEREQLKTQADVMRKWTKHAEIKRFF